MMIIDSVLIVGCGGLGGYVIEELARLGIKKMTLIDGDVFCESNTNRQLESGLDTLGKSKALVYKERLHDKFGIDAVAIDSFLEEKNADIVSSVDIVMDCVDSIKCRFFLEKVCEKYEKILVHGGVEGPYGQACVCYPGDSTLSKLYKEQEEKKHVTNVFTVATVASMQAALVKKMMDGKEVRNKLYLLDMDELDIREIKL